MEAIKSLSSPRAMCKWNVPKMEFETLSRRQDGAGRVRGRGRDRLFNRMHRKFRTVQLTLILVILNALINAHVHDSANGFATTRYGNTRSNRRPRSEY
jgi:hypothetical protein